MSPVPTLAHLSSRQLPATLVSPTPALSPVSLIRKQSPDLTCRCSRVRMCLEQGRGRQPRSLTHVLPWSLLPAPCFYFLTVCLGLLSLSVLLCVVPIAPRPPPCLPCLLIQNQEALFLLACHVVHPHGARLTCLSLSTQAPSHGCVRVVRFQKPVGTLPGSPRGCPKGQSRDGQHDS